MKVLCHYEEEVYKKLDAFKKVLEEYETRLWEEIKSGRRKPRFLQTKNNLFETDHGRQIIKCRIDNIILNAIPTRIEIVGDNTTGKENE